MAAIRITKEFKFEMAHALMNYNGPCRNIHGHSYYLYVTLIGEPTPQHGASESGMVMDFGQLKKIVRESIVDELDHALLLNDKTPAEEIAALKNFNKVVLVPFQPTCENLLVDFAARIKPLLPAHVKLYSMKLCETVTSFAEWYASDNP
jgi:6-pyruvoyltetrahydropterin/6-carboxytetrahydropterin synthase